MTSTAKLKAAAQGALQPHERLSALPPNDIFDISLAEGTQLDADITAVNAFHDESTPAKILELIAALEAAEKRIAELEQSEYQLIKERDYAEAALADMYKAATGEAPELSNWFGYADAVDAVEGRIAELEKRVGAAGINLETGGE